MKNRKLIIILLLASIFIFALEAVAQDPTAASNVGAGAKVTQQLVMSPKEFIFGTIQFLCMGLIVYFLMVINPGKTSEESHFRFMENLKKNDDVITSTGLYGKVVSISPDGIGLEIAPNVKVRFDPKYILPLPKADTKAK